MIPYLTIHESPMSSILKGIQDDILRYESGKKIVTERQSYGRGYTPWSHKARTYILEIIKERAPIGTVEIAKITGRNRSSIHSDTLIMEDEGVIKRRKRGRLVFWEVA